MHISLGREELICVDDEGEGGQHAPREICTNKKLDLVFWIPTAVMLVLTKGLRLVSVTPGTVEVDNMDLVVLAMPAGYTKLGGLDEAWAPPMVFLMEDPPAVGTFSVGQNKNED